MRRLALCWLGSGLLVWAFASPAAATMITFSGTIIQRQDQTNQAVNNPALNQILLGDAYSVTLTFPGSINSAGAHNPLSGPTLLFGDPSAPASEGSFSSVSLTVSADGSNYDLSLLGCLSTGSACGVGNFLSVNFQIPASGLNLKNISTTGLDQPHPLDLQEDDGSTDIHGSIGGYSYFGTVGAVPEPSTAWPLCIVTAVMVGKFGRRHHAIRTEESLRQEKNL